MRKRTAWSPFLLFFCCVAGTNAQGVALPSTTLYLTATDVRSAVVPAGATSILLPFTVEADTTGGNIFDVATSDPAVVVSLILPSGTEVTTSNAASLGFVFTTAAGDNFEIPSVFSLPGTHTTIQIAGGQASGAYQIKANAAATTSSSGIIATYFSSSSARAVVTTDAANYKVGDTVILSGLVFDGATPITGATVTTALSTPLSLDSQAGVFRKSLQLVESTEESW